MASPIGPAQRERLEHLVARGQHDEALRLLDQWVRQHELTPWAMEWLGRMFLARGDVVAAGRAFFWAGRRDGEGVAAAIGAFLRRPPAGLLTSLPRRARVAFERLPDTVQQDLLASGVTPELAAAILVARRPVQWGRVLGRLLLGGLAFVGALTVLSWLGRWLGS